MSMTLADRYRLMVEHSSDVVFLVDRAGTLLWVSPSIRKFSGQQIRQLVGRPISSYLAPGTEDAAAAALQAVVSGREAHFEGQVEDRDGDLRWVAVTAGPTIDADGNVTGGVGTARDITEVVTAIEARSDSERRYRLLADHAADVVAQMDTDRRIVWMSPSVTSVLGWTVEEMVGRDLRRLLPPRRPGPVDRRSRTVLRPPSTTVGRPADIGANADQGRELPLDGRSAFGSDGR